MNDLCINYMASMKRFHHRRQWLKLQHMSFEYKQASKLPRLFWFGNPKAAGFSTFPFSSCLFTSMSLQFCGIWWSLRIMFPSQLYSSLNLICISTERRKNRKASKKKLWDYDQRAWVFFFFSQIRFCASQRWPQAFSYEVLFIHKTAVRGSPFLPLPSSDIVVAECFFSSTTEIKKLRYFYSLAVVSVSHGEWLHAFMASDYASVSPFNVV